MLLPLQILINLRAGGGGITGTLAATEAQDTASLAGVLGHTGTLAATEAQDTAAFSGKHGQTGALDATEAQDVAAFAGTVSSGSITGTLAATEAQDSAAFTGDVVSSAPVKVGGDDAPSPHKGFDLKEWKKKRRLDDSIEAEIERIYFGLKPEYKEQAAQVIEKAKRPDRLISALAKIESQMQDDEDIEAILLIL